MDGTGAVLGRVGRSALLVNVALLTVGTRQAPTPVPAEQDTIVVTGSQMDRDEVRDRAVDFVERIGVVDGMRPVARWVDPICPRVLGLQDSYSRIVERKIRIVAETAGVPVANGPCAGNIVVTFAAGGAGVARQVATRAPRRLAEVPIEERAALLEGTAPVRWWYSSDERSSHGMGARDTPAVAVAGSVSKGADAGIPVGVPVLQHYNSSIISTQSVRVLTSATVIVDLDQVLGMPLDAVASYAALVALAEIGVGDYTPMGSILALFESEPGLRGPTERDVAFLRALYRLPLDRMGRTQRGYLIRELISAEMGETGLRDGN